MKQRSMETPFLNLNPDNLPEEAMVNVEEDYQVCARMLARDAGKGQMKAGKGVRKGL